jgi:hypothetical protein
MDYNGCADDYSIKGKQCAAAKQPSGVWSRKTNNELHSPYQFSCRLRFFRSLADRLPDVRYLL